MSRRRQAPVLSPRRALLLIGAILWPLALPAADLLRAGRPTPTKDAAATDGTTPATVTPAAAPALLTSQDRLARTTQSLTAIRQMQLAARDLAKSATGGLKPGLPAVPTNSFGVPGGLIVAQGVTANSARWSGAQLPTMATTTANGTTTSEVTIKQEAQQAVLNWDSFNIGRDTTLTFDQSLGGANVGRWIAFNIVRDPSASPTQILGTLRTVGPADAQGKPQVGGQVYVLNTNGIIFGGSAQVNTHALVASALPLNYNVLQSGLLNNPDTQFQFSALALTGGNRGPTPAFTPGTASADGSIPVQASYATDGHYGDVEVQAGAQLVAPTNVDKAGGRVALIGANVSNAGTISTPNGQTILAAGLQVGLAASSDPSLRGLNVYVGAEAAYSGAATNATGGLIDGQRADDKVVDTAVTIVGRTVSQLGAIDATTSVSLNSRVDLLAEYNAVGNPRYSAGLSFSEFLHNSTEPDPVTGAPVLGADSGTGLVVLGAASITRLLPDWSSTERIVGATLKLPSQVNLRGQSVYLAGTADSAAAVIVPGGKVTVDAGRWVMNNGLDFMLHSSGQIYLDAGAAIDVAGSRDVVASVDENIVEVELRGPQLADNPLLRDSVLRGQTIKVDLRQTGVFNGRSWIGTPLADASGYVGLVQHTVGQLTTNGGTVALNAGDSIVLNRQSVIDVSGGWINYQGGEIETTKLLSGGRVFDIALATPDRAYDGIYNGVTSTTDQKWGVTQTTVKGFPVKSYEPGYRQGGSGGSVALTAAAMALDGSLAGTTVAGTRQRTTAGQLAKTYADSNMLAVIQAGQAVPTASSLRVAFERDYLKNDGTAALPDSPVAPQVVLSATPSTVPAVAAFPLANATAHGADLGDRGLEGASVSIATDWFGAASGFGNFTLRNGDGDVLIKSNLALLPGGALSIDAANITIAPGVQVSAPAGSLSFTAHNYSPYAYQADVALSDVSLPDPDDERGRFFLGAGASLSTAGQIVDDRAGRAGAGTAGLFSNGYRLDAAGAEVTAVSIRAYGIELADQSVIDVSGGVVASAAAKLTYGSAGRISLLGVLDPQGDATLPIGQSSVLPVDPAARGYLRFNPDRVRLVGYAGVGGRSGALTLQAQQIQIGNSTDPLAPANLDPTGTLRLTAGFFGRDGIGNYTLTGLGSVARDEDGALLADQQGPGRLYVPGAYVAPGTALKIEPQGWIAAMSPYGLGPVLLNVSSVTLPAAAQSATSFRLAAAGIDYRDVDTTLLYRGDLKFGAGASVTLGQKGIASLNGGTVQFDGSIRAPGGTISVTGANTYQFDVDVALTDPVLPTVELGAASRLDASGAVLAPAGFALGTGVLGESNTGSVLAGGSIAVQGNLVARGGSVLDVSGAAGVLDLLPAYSGGTDPAGAVPTRIESDAGSIKLKGGQVLVSNATLRGEAGGGSAQGGSLTVASSSFVVGERAPSDLTLEVSTAGVTLAPGGSLLGRSLVDAGGTAVASLGHFATTDFWSPATQSSPGGFTSLTLEGNVQFTGAVELAAARSLTIGTGGFLYSVADATKAQDVKLRAPSVTLGLPFSPPVNTANGTQPQLSIFRDSSNAPAYLAPTFGFGTFSVEAESLISLGSLSFQGFGTADFRTAKNGVAVAGDIRGNGVVDLAGAMSFTAGQIYPSTGVNLVLAAYDYFDSRSLTIMPGSITFNPVLDATGKVLLPALPLSAAGSLTVYARQIQQNGVLRAPFGVINLGWNGTGTAPTSVGGAPADLLTGTKAAVPVTATLALGAQSITSVSGVDPVTGKGIIVPYGYSTDGLNWFDPTGADITSLGPPSKSVSLSAKTITDVTGSVVDLRGGGDLYAYQWVPGVGGTRDVLASTYVPNPSAASLASYAILPDYEAGFAPYAAFANGTAAEGFVTGSGLATGDVVHLDLGDGRGARDYTLLPARYALLPGAYLVTSVTGAPPAKPVTQADGAKIVSGYRANSLADTAAPVYAAFELALGTPATSDGIPKSTVRARSQYSDYFANLRFAAAPDPAIAPTWRLPQDAGALRLLAAGSGAVTFDGDVLATAATGSNGRGGTVDVSTPGDILVANSLATDEAIAKWVTDFNLTAPLVLRTSTLNGFGAESLLLGGYRTSTTAGSQVTVATGRLAVANPGEALAGPDIILAANTAVTLGDGAVINSNGVGAIADKLILGRVDATTLVPVAGSGNGALVRVASDANATIRRYGADQTTLASLVVGKDVKLGAATGAHGGVIIDSTNATKLDPSIAFSSAALALDSGQISLLFPGAGSLRGQPATGLPTTGLVLTSASLDALQTSGTSLSLLSYSSLDFYGSGQLGGATTASLALHAPEIRGDGGDVVIQAKRLVLDNSAAAAAPDGAVPGATTGTLRLVGDELALGAGAVAIQRYGTTSMEAAKQIVFDGAGSVTTEGDLALATPLITGTTASSQKLAAAGTFVLTGTPATTRGTGLGANLTLEGTSLAVAGRIDLPTGAVTLHATGPAATGDVTVTGTVDVSGVGTAFYDLVRYTEGGQVSLVSDHGKVSVAETGVVDVSGAKPLAADTARATQARASNAGVLAVEAKEGNFAVAGQLAGAGAETGQGGAFQLDTGTLPAVAAGQLLTAINSGGFDRSQQMRVRTGDVVIAGETKAREFSLSADAGSVAITGHIDASGATGGSVSVAAGGSVTLATDGVIDASGQDFDAAGKGGAVRLEAGATRFDRAGVVIAPVATAAVDLQGRIDVSVDTATAADAAFGRVAGTVHLRAPQVDASGVAIPAGSDATAGVDVAVKPITGMIVGASSVVVEGNRVFTPPAGVVDAVKQAVFDNGTAFMSQAGSAAAPGAIRNRLLASQPGLASILHVQPGAEIVNPVLPGATAAVLNAGTANSTVFLPAGAAFTLSGLTSATSRIVSSSGTGRVLLPGGQILNLTTASTNITLPAGTQVILDTAGVVTVNVARSGAGAGTGTLQLENGAILGGTAGGTFAAGTGTWITLVAANSSVLSVPASTPVVLLNGGRVRFATAGTYTTPAGVTTSFAAAATPTVPAGSTVRLSGAGTITALAAGIQVALDSGSYAMSGNTSLNAARGDLRLQADWDLSTNRYAASTGFTGEPGVLTLRGSGNLVFNGALSDGFASTAYDAALLAAGNRSTSYRLAAGADLAAADYRRVLPLASLGTGTGSLMLGQNGVGPVPSNEPPKIVYLVGGHFQVVRTGTGDIDIAAGRDVLLLNQFAGIYTTGTQVADPAMAGTFDVPELNQAQNVDGQPLGPPQQDPSYPAQFTQQGGNVSVVAQGDIAHKTRDSTGRLGDDSEQQLPNNWLYRRGLIDPATGRFLQGTINVAGDGEVSFSVDNTGEVRSTAWWVDFSNFFEGIGALGGGNVSLQAGRDVLNVDAVVPTNARMAGREASGAPLGPDLANLIELGGGDLSVRAGRDINGGAYYVERGDGRLAAGRNILTNVTRALGTANRTNSETWLPTTLFLGKGDFRVTAAGDLRLGPVGNPFLMPAGISNTVWNKTYFTTYDPGNEVDVSSLTGSVRLSENAPDGMLYSWLRFVQLYSTATTGNISSARPWLRLTENAVEAFRTMTTLAPATLRATAFSGDLNIAGDLNLAPSPTGTIELAAQKSITGLNPLNRTKAWGYGTIRLLDSAPSAMPGPDAPIATLAWMVGDITRLDTTIFSGVDGLLREGENTANDSLPTKQARHAAGLLHAADTSPLRIYSLTGDISGLGLMAGKAGRIVAGRDLTDISLVLQNTRAADVSVVAAGRDLVAFAPNSALRQTAAVTGFVRGNERTAGKTGRIEIGGPGALEVMAGRNFDLGVDPANAALGLTSIGSARNPSLPFGGADILAAAGLGKLYTAAAAAELRAPGLAGTAMDFPAFIAAFLQPTTPRGTRYLPVLAGFLGLDANTPPEEIAAAIAPGQLTEKKRLAVMNVFFTALRNSGRDRNKPDSKNFGTYADGFDAIQALFPGSPVPTKEQIATGLTGPRPASPGAGNLVMATREIGTFEGGDISVLLPSGGLTVGRATDAQKADQGILTARGGRVSIYATDNVEVGTSRIFTLRGGDEMVWSTWGNIAAGSGSKTVFSAPPTRVIIDPQSGDVQNDLAGLATGSGIGVLSTLSGVKPADIDLIAPVGTVDAGDAGIRASGNLNVAARVVLNAANIQVGGVSVGTPPPPSTPNLGSLAAAGAATTASASAATDVAARAAQPKQALELPSLISVEVLGYGGEGDEDDDDKKPAGGTTS